MKHLLFIALCLPLFTIQAFAQSLPLETSEGFDEPQALACKVVQCRNGNTFLFSFTAKDGIGVRLYGKDRKLIADSSYRSKLYDYRDMKNGHIPAIYESDDEVVIFREEQVSYVPVLYRMHISTATGALLSEQVAARLDGYQSDRLPVKLGGVVPARAFHMTRDASTGEYAIVSFNGLTTDNPQRIQIQLLDKHHQELDRGWYDDATSTGQRVQFIGMCMANQQLYLSTYRYYGKDSADLYLSRLTIQTPPIAHRATGLHKDFKNSVSAMLWNAGTNKIELLTTTYLENTKKLYAGMLTNNYRNTLSAFDAGTLALSFSKTVSADPVKQHQQQVTNRHSIYGGMISENDYDGMAMGLVLNQDHSTTVLLQAMQNTADNANPTALDVMKSSIGDIGSIRFDKNLQAGKGYFIPCRQDFRLMVPPCAINTRHNAQISFQRGKIGEVYIDPGYYAFDCVSAGNIPYVIFNDHPENLSKDPYEKRQNMVALSQSNTICYKLSGEKPQPVYFLGRPDKETYRFSNIAAADYNSETRIYATLMIERKQRSKQAHIAWVHF